MLITKLISQRQTVRLVRVCSQAFSSSSSGGRRHADSRYTRKSQKHNTDYEGPIESQTFATRAEGQKKLKEFMKHVHPDFFAHAPENVKQTNSKNVQELNEYFQSLKNLRDARGQEEKILSFYIKRGKDSKEYQKFEIILASLRSGSSPEIKSKHYSNVVESLSHALDKTLDKIGAFDEQVKDGFEEVDPNGYQFKTQLSWEDSVRGAEKPKTVFARMQKELYLDQRGKEMSVGIHKLAREAVLRNLYKSYYDLPNDLKARKADATMRAVVETSETLGRVETLHEHGLHPKLIFFGNELYENQVQACMRELHGTGKDDSKLNRHYQNLRTINDMLLACTP